MYSDKKSMPPSWEELDQMGSYPVPTLRLKVRTNRYFNFIVAIESHKTIRELAHRVLNCYIELAEEHLNGSTVPKKRELTVSSIQLENYFISKQEIVGAILSSDDTIFCTIIKAKPKFPKESKAYSNTLKKMNNQNTLKPALNLHQLSCPVKQDPIPPKPMNIKKIKQIIEAKPVAAKPIEVRPTVTVDFNNNLVRKDRKREKKQQKMKKLKELRQQQAEQKKKNTKLPIAPFQIPITKSLPVLPLSEKQQPDIKLVVLKPEQQQQRKGSEHLIDEQVGKDFANVVIENPQFENQFKEKEVKATKVKTPQFGTKECLENQVPDTEQFYLQAKPNSPQRSKEEIPSSNSIKKQFPKQEKGKLKPNNVEKMNSILSMLYETVEGKKKKNKREKQKEKQKEKEKVQQREKEKIPMEKQLKVPNQNELRIASPKVTFHNSPAFSPQAFDLDAPKRKTSNPIIALDKFELEQPKEQQKAAPTKDSQQKNKNSIESKKAVGQQSTTSTTAKIIVQEQSEAESISNMAKQPKAMTRKETKLEQLNAKINKYGRDILFMSDDDSE